MSVTLHAAVHLGEDQPLKSLRHLFKVTERLITDQTEITWLTTIEWQQPVWRETTLLTDRAVQFATAKTYVFSDSVHGRYQWRTSQSVGSRIKRFFEARYLKDLGRIHGEPLEFEWKNFPGFTTLGIIDEISWNKYLKKKKMKTQSREAIKPTRIGSTLPKTGGDGLYQKEITQWPCKNDRNENEDNATIKKSREDETMTLSKASAPQPPSALQTATWSIWSCSSRTAVKNFVMVYA